MLHIITAFALLCNLESGVVTALVLCFYVLCRTLSDTGVSLWSVLKQTAICCALVIADLFSAIAVVNIYNLFVIIT